MFDTYINGVCVDVDAWYKRVRRYLCKHFLMLSFNVAERKRELLLHKSSLPVLELIFL